MAPARRLLAVDVVLPVEERLAKRSVVSRISPRPPPTIIVLKILRRCGD
jgi:hypothetical protein